MAAIKKYANKIVNWTAFPVFVLLIALLIINSFVSKNSLSSSFISSFLNSNSAVICVSIGVSVVIISGGIDISLGSILSMCNVLAVKLMTDGMPYYWAIILTLVAATAAGAINGFVVAYMRVTPLLTTFATSTIFAGCALIIMSVPGGRIAKELTEIYYSKPLGIPMTVFLILIPCIIWKVYKYTPSGIRLYATGQDQGRAFLSGINVTFSKMFVYCFAGFCAGIGALAITCMVGGGDPLIGSTVVMTAISAAVIGGVSLSGGRGDIAGGIFGCLFLGLLTNIVVSMRLDVFSQGLLTAAILLLGILVAVAVGSNRVTKGALKRGSKYDTK